ncbi:hypothetical protein A2U01_0082508, partial [Trifolium medium]|nr:hypothetical protein [Trifolium medium]
MASSVFRGWKLHVALGALVRRARGEFQNLATQR